MIRGWLLVNLIAILKFIDINYPQNVVEFFESRTEIKNVISLPDQTVNKADDRVLHKIND